MPGEMISPNWQETMDSITDAISRTVLGNVSSWLAANPGRDPGALLPVVMLELQPPKLMLALRTDT